MSKNKKNARPDVAASERAVENGSVHETAHDSTTKNTTVNLPGQVVHIADFLSHGPESGVTLRHLEKLTSLDKSDHSTADRTGEAGWSADYQRQQKRLLFD